MDFTQLQLFIMILQRESVARRLTPRLLLAISVKRKANNQSSEKLLGTQKRLVPKKETAFCEFSISASLLALFLL